MLQHRLPLPRASYLFRFLTCLLFVAAPLAAQDDPEATAEPAGIRLLPPLQGIAEGPTEIESLTLTAEIARLVFYLDEQEVAQRKRPPWTARLPFAVPAREQTVRVEAFNTEGRDLGQDTLVVNRFDPPLRVRVAALETLTDGLRVSAKVSIPRDANLAELRFWVNQDQVGTVRAEPFELHLDLTEPQPEDFLRLELELVDGRTVEDVHLLASGAPGERIDVNLVQLQALVTAKHGPPVTDLQLADFEIRQRGKAQQIDRLFAAEDIALVLGLLVDTSGSMVPIWQQTQAAAKVFLDGALGPRDRSFVVSFDSELRLVQSLTGDLEQLHQALASIHPNREGMTALYDSILYSMLQFAEQPGRRALVVLTDGFESSSRADPKRAVEFGRKLGVPVYVVALPGGGGMRGVSFSAALQELKLLTQPTGGRLLRVGSGEGLERAFAQISAELRHQYVLTYYTDDPPAGLGRRQVEVLVKGRRGVEVRTIVALDQVQ